MKLRIKGNSLRLRLGQSEVRSLAADDRVEETTAFGPDEKHCFGYSLAVSYDELGVRAEFENRRIVVRVPRDLIQAWAATDQVGIEAVQPNGDQEELRILVEKDFECIDAPANESQEDAFPNPLRDTACQPVGV